MLTGKYWITPGGVVDVTTSEHALYAKNVMLGLFGTPKALKLDKHLFSPLSPAVLRRHKRRGVAEEILAHLGQGIDSRLYAIQVWGWVRVRGPAFYLWRSDRKTVKMIRDAKAYWKTQSKMEPTDPLDLISLSDSKTRVMLARELHRIAGSR